MPRPMTHTSARLLEFDSLRDLLRGYAASDLGRARVQGLAPSTDVSWIQSQQQLTSEVREFRRAAGSFNFSGLIDVSKILEKSRISGVALDPEEIVSVITVVDRAA
ncbi:MAG TPA: endonuclease MutS2, partial [Terriglobales bacterium]|nr:endonuclease MutS2 [Terriglobales bacterium]